MKYLQPPPLKHTLALINYASLLQKGPETVLCVCIMCVYHDY